MWRQNAARKIGSERSAFLPGADGRRPQQVVLPNGEKFTAFSWEKTDRAEALRKDAGLKAAK